MIEHILITNNAELTKITLRELSTDHEISVNVERIADNENVIEISIKSLNIDVPVKFLNMYIKDEDLILFMVNVEQYISRNCCKKSMPDFSKV
jgi:hypothetical protein